MLALICICVGPSESGLCRLLFSTTAVVIMLGLITFGVWHEQDSGKAGEGGGGQFWQLLKQGSSTVRC